MATGEILRPYDQRLPSGCLGSAGGEKGWSVQTCGAVEHAVGLEQGLHLGSAALQQGACLFHPRL